MPGNKKEYIEGMFDKISRRYDFLNHFLSLGIDKYWRKKTIRLLSAYHPLIILDVATGTADMAIKEAQMLKPDKVIGIDLSSRMLEIGKMKVRKNKLEQIVELQEGDSESIHFESNKFDAVTVAFGVRNFENIEKGLSEMCRVLKTGGKALILEFSIPQKKLIRSLYLFYFKHILPFFGKLVSGNEFAYTYLPASVAGFPQRNNFLNMMQKAGFTGVDYKTLSLGICTIYSGTK